MEKTWKPTVAGILQIVSGAVGLVAVIGLIIAISVTGGFYIPGTESIPRFVSSLLTGIAVPLAILSGLSLAGGVYALQRKLWGLHWLVQYPPYFVQSRYWVVFRLE